jgi:hypothetical protein
MQHHFLEAGDRETAALFRRSSMEQAIKTVPLDSPLCVVPELPLFVLTAPHDGPLGVPATLVAFQDALPDLLTRAIEGDSLSSAVEQFGIRCLGLGSQVRLHLRLLDLALATVAEG